MATPTHNREERFWSKVAKSGPADCWNWTGAQFYGRDAGYGKLLWQSKPMPIWRRAHRVAWELTYGPITNPKICVCHTCDNPLCCNPAHLWLGTIAANNYDREAKGRGASHLGQLNPNAKINEKIAEEIREAVKMGETQSGVARRYGISQPHVWKIVHGWHW
jgi:hypothetical protein